MVHPVVITKNVIQTQTPVLFAIMDIYYTVKVAVKNTKILLMVNVAIDLNVFEDKIPLHVQGDRNDKSICM